MGFDMVVYFCVNQEQIENFIVENNIDRNDWKQDKRIVDFYKLQKPELKQFNIIYEWNEPCRLHKFYDSFGTNFIRDDPKLSNPRLPFCLQSIHYNLCSAEDAIEIADAIHRHLKEDKHYRHFAEWLRATSKYCVHYELSC